MTIRVIAGKYKGKTLEYPMGDPNVRPTQDRVKEAIFSILQLDIGGAVVLDLFCGIGSLGIEAASRGASSVVLVDQNTKWAQKNCPADDPQISIVRAEAQRYLAQTTTEFDGILMDAPYDKINLIDAVIATISVSPILKPGGWLVCEHKRRVKPQGFKRPATVREYHYGETTVTVWRSGVAAISETH
jgi:16S rRNA (guanine966-N2)-methyltransferase